MLTFDVLTFDIYTFSMSTYVYAPKEATDQVNSRTNCIFIYLFIYLHTYFLCIYIRTQGVDRPGILRRRCIISSGTARTHTDRHTHTPTHARTHTHTHRHTGVMHPETQAHHTDKTHTHTLSFPPSPSH